MATAMADGYATEMAAAMVDGNRNGNGQRRWQQQWATATLMAMELTTTTEMAKVIAMATDTARATITQGGLSFHVPAM
jgi:hypothetical protein